jgi:hypothetical protein
LSKNPHLSLNNLDLNILKNFGIEVKSGRPEKIPGLAAFKKKSGYALDSTGYNL